MATKRGEGGGQVKFYPYEKGGGGGKGLSHVWGSFLRGSLKFKPY